MSRRVDFFDNAVAERFFSPLKNELVAGTVFESRNLARSEIFEYIESFYNRQRIHQSLNYRTPPENGKWENVGNARDCGDARCKYPSDSRLRENDCWSKSLRSLMKPFPARQVPSDRNKLVP